MSSVPDGPPALDASVLPGLVGYDQAALDAAGEPVRETLLNRRADGSVFWNELLLAPVRHGGGDVTHVAGYQVDVTSRVTAHAAHDRFLEAERRARAQAAGGRAPR
ncbi:PAS domain-containing protein [Kineococcus sp. LSe6-4]|uniref:PAS domain-containing protein n=1 Tax=Kineococcus halophytocola TaxID=3234027 RepID=A0ABV4H256_9ACTN